MSAHTAQTELKLIGKLILEGEMHCETGLHVGAGKGSLEIGGSDNPVVKDAFGRPYVPGSSLRGKIRSLLEQSSGLAVPSELVYLSRRKGQEVRIHQSDRPDDEICLLFGRNPGRMERVQGETLDTTQATPARLAVFDAPLDPESITAADAREPGRRTDRSEERERHRPHHLAGQSAHAGTRSRRRALQDAPGDGRAVRRGRAAVPARAGRAAPAGRRRAGRRRFARQRPRELLQAEAGVARQELLRHRRGRKGNRRRRHAGRHSEPPSTKPHSPSCARSNESRDWSSNCVPPDPGASDPIRARATAWTPSITAIRSTRPSPPPWRGWARWKSGWMPPRAPAQPAVCFSSCFPFLDEIGFVVPPRTIWPPTRRPPCRARVRWKSARFVPLGVVQATPRRARRSTRTTGPSMAPASAWCPPAAPRSVPHRRALERRGGPADRRGRAPLHRLHRISPGRRSVDRRLFRR